jgi:hypothetical protein
MPCHDFTNDPRPGEDLEAFNIEGFTEHPVPFSFPDSDSNIKTCSVSRRSCRGMLSVTDVVTDVRG